MTKMLELINIEPKLNTNGSEGDKTNAIETEKSKQDEKLLQEKNDEINEEMSKIIEIQDSKIKDMSKEVAILKEVIENLQNELSQTKEKYEKDIEEKVVEISKVTHDLSKIAHENENLKSDKIVLQKLLESKESIDDNKLKREPIVVDSHIPEYISRKKKKTVVVEVSDDEEADNEDVDVNNPFQEVRRRGRKVSSPKEQRDFDARPRTCHFWNNSKYGCRNEDDKCKFLHKEAPPCKDGDKCRGIIEFRRCQYFHDNLDFLFQGKPRSRPPIMNESRTISSAPSRFTSPIIPRTDHHTYTRRSEGRYGETGERRY